MIFTKKFRIKTFFSKILTPQRIFILSFVGLILVGTFFLSLPLAASKHSLRFIDALFTSTSAVCVTGLTVLDIGKDLTFAGQVVTIILFQIGGLGIITFSTIFFVLMGRGISFKGRDIVQSTFLHTPRMDFFVILKSVIWFTLFFEGLGTLFLWIRFSRDFSTGPALFHALYNAISAFNNCGYSLFSDNLIGYQGDLIVNLTIMGMIIMGGIGFVVQFELLAKIKKLRKKLSLHTKIVLITTLVLILSGAFIIYVMERNLFMKGLPLQNQILASFFQAVTPRTAGFNTVDIGRLANETILIIIMFMFIGASPGSTGGGIKTTSAAPRAMGQILSRLAMKTAIFGFHSRRIRLPAIARRT